MLKKKKNWVETHNYFRSYGNKLFINVNYLTGKEHRGNEQKDHTLCIKRNCKNIIAALLVPLWFGFVSIFIVSPYFPCLITQLLKVCSVHRRLAPRGTPCISFCSILQSAVLSQAGGRGCTLRSGSFWSFHPPTVCC